MLRWFKVAYFFLVFLLPMPASAWIPDDCGNEIVETLAYQELHPLFKDKRIAPRLNRIVLQHARRAIGIDPSTDEALPLSLDELLEMPGSEFQRRYPEIRLEEIDNQTFIRAYWVLLNKKMDRLLDRRSNYRGGSLLQQAQGLIPAENGILMIIHPKLESYAIEKFLRKRKLLDVPRLALVAEDYPITEPALTQHLTRAVYSWGGTFRHRLKSNLFYISGESLVACVANTILDLIDTGLETYNEMTFQFQASLIEDDVDEYSLHGLFAASDSKKYLKKITERILTGANDFPENLLDYDWTQVQISQSYSRIENKHIIKIPRKDGKQVTFIFSNP